MGVITKEEWQKECQEYEFNYHEKQGINWCSNDNLFNEYWENIKSWIGKENIKGNVLDIGCGPRPPFEGFYIEPLAEKYQQITKKSWWSNRQGFSCPAEEFVNRLPSMDLVVCWNCLDHTFDWKNILENVLKYLKDDGLFILATDIRPPAKGHPGFNKGEWWQFISAKFRILEMNIGFSERDLCLKLKKK